MFDDGETPGYSSLDDWFATESGSMDEPDDSVLDDAIAANDENAAQYDELILDRMREAGFDVGNMGSSVVSDLLGWAKSQIMKPDGSVDWAKLGTGAAGIYALFGGGSDIKQTGWSAPPPKMDVTRMQVQPSDPNRRPGEGGQRYFTDAQFTPTGDAAALQAARDRATAQIPQLKQAPRPAPAAPSGLPAIRTAWEPPTPAPVAEQEVPSTEPTTQMAGGGQVPNFQGHLQSGGFVVPGDVVRHADPAGGADKERGLAALHQTLGAQAIRGPGDAMSDSIPTTIDGNQPAAVANGEAYVPPQQVARAGGTDRLYQMMDRLRLERTGSRKQINPDNPRELQSAYQQGGGVRRFNGTTGSGVTSGTAGGTTATSYGESTTNTLAPYIGEYVTSALSQGAAMANTPYQAYQGPLTAGANAQQQQAFAGASQLAQTGFTPGQFTATYQAPQTFQQTQFTNQFTAPEAFKANTFTSADMTQADTQRYMNPYLNLSLDPQLQEARRQADIARLADSARLTKAGAYGGSRQAIMESEGRRNLMDIQGQITGRGYDTAYQQALAQFNADRKRDWDAQTATEQSRQFGATQGMTEAQERARYGLAALQGQAADRQFSTNQAMETARLKSAEQQAVQRAAEESRQFSAKYGMDALDRLTAAGKTQRDIEAEGIAADKAQFEEERAYAYGQPAYQLGLLSGIPIGGSTTTPNTTGLESISNQLGNLTALYKSLSGVLDSKPAATTAP